MSSVGSTLKADVVEQQKLMSTAVGSVRPAQTSVSQASLDEASISRMGRMRGSTIVVQDVVNALTQDQAWQAQRVRSSHPDQVEATSSGARPGTHEVEVRSTAQAQVSSSPSFTSLSTLVGIGTLNIEMGDWSNTSSTFTTNPNWPKANVTLGPKDNTLERVRDRINAAGVGVVAAVVSDATGSRLVLSASRTGADNGFKVSADPAVNAMTDAAPLSSLSLDTADGNTKGLQRVQAAQDASLSINGRPLTSASNFVDDSESGLQLQLKRPTEGSVRLSVEPDDDLLQRRLQALTASVNDLREQAGADSAEPIASPARLEATSVLDTMREQLQGPQAPAWQAIGLSWNEPNGLQQQAVTWTPELRRMGQQLFSQLNQQISPSSPSGPSGQSGPSGPSEPPQPAMPSESGASSAAVALNRQRLLDQYLDPAAAPAEPVRQDFAVS
jgi:flagellar hook-associated protein 2